MAKTQASVEIKREVGAVFGYAAGELSDEEFDAKRRRLEGG